MHEAGSDRQNYSCPDCNVILISIDTLRADHLGCYGYRRDTSPNIDKLASEGILFENSFSNSINTLLSHMSIMTSQYPAVHGVSIVDDFNQRLDNSKVTLAELLKCNGYATAAFTGGGWVSPEFGFDQGFDRYVTIDTLYDNEGLLNETVQWLEDNHGKKFFLFLHTYSVHSPYITKWRFNRFLDSGYPGSMIDSMEDIHSHKGMTKEECYNFFASINRSDPRDIGHAIDLYDEGILYTDFYVGKILEEISNLGLDDKTVIILTSDHGEDLMEHGMIAHHYDLYVEQTHVPLIIRLPNLMTERKVSLAEGIDVMPTILDMIGIPPVPGMQGTSLIQEPREDEEVFIEGGHSCSRYNLAAAGYTGDAGHCDGLDLLIMRKFCLGSLDISFCEELPTSLKGACKGLNHHNMNSNFTYDQVASLFLNAVLENRTASEACREIYTENSPAYTEPVENVAVMNEEFKYIYRYGPWLDELYDLANDPTEQANIIDERPEVADEMRAELLEWHNGNKKLASYWASDAEISEKTLEQLRALGYI